MLSAGARADAPPSATTASASVRLTATAGGTIELQHADRVEYLEQDQRVHLSGNVRVQFEGNRIRADEVRMDLAGRTIEATGHLVWEGDDLTATGSRMTFDLKSKTGTVEDVTMAAGPWLCRGAKVDQPEPRTVTVAPGEITTCDAPVPHYRIRCRRIRIRMERDLVATSVTILAGTTPVFWLPVLATPLREFRLPFEAQVGRTSELGMFVRTSPAFSLSPRAPGQLHLDYFERTGWGLGLTQEWRDANGKRALRAHGYRIRERTPARPDLPVTRWEGVLEGARGLWPGARIAASADVLSDPLFRQHYGNAKLVLPVTAGERRARVLLSQAVKGWNVSALVERADTLRLTDSATGNGRYTMSSVEAPQIAAASPAVPLSDWLSMTLRARTNRSFIWQNGWWVNAASVTPGLDAWSRIPVLGRLTTSPRVTSSYRDRGDRVLKVEDDMLAEDANRGVVWQAEAGSSLRQDLAPGLDHELSHAVSKRLNKIGYDPFNYRGLLVHRVGSRLGYRPGRIGEARISAGYDLRNTQDPPKRRWSPVTPGLTLRPAHWLSLSADAEYDVWFGKFRGASGSLGIGREGEGPFVRLTPRFTDNRLALSNAASTAQDYRLARYLYGSSFQDANGFARILTVDAEAVTPILPNLRGSALAQWDGNARRVHVFTATLTRNLHCWELQGTFQRFADGELRFHLSLGLAAFPAERVPLLSL